jgi:hypothetical protein
MPMADTNVNYACRGRGGRAWGREERGLAGWLARRRCRGEGLGSCCPAWPVATCLEGCRASLACRPGHAWPACLAGWRRAPPGGLRTCQNLMRVVAMATLRRLYGMMGDKRRMSTSFQPSSSIALSMYSHFCQRPRTNVSTQSLSRYLRRKGREGWRAGKAGKEGWRAGKGGVAGCGDSQRPASWPSGRPLPRGGGSAGSGAASARRAGRPAGHWPRHVAPFRSALRSRLGGGAQAQGAPASDGRPPTHLASRKARAWPTAPPIHTANRPFQNLQAGRRGLSFSSGTATLRKTPDPARTVALYLKQLPCTLSRCPAP